MSVAHDLQTIVADLSVAIAGRQTFGRTELDRLRRRLGDVAKEAQRGETQGVVLRTIADDVIGAIDAGVINLQGVATSARERMGVA